MFEMPIFKVLDGEKSTPSFFFGEGGGVNNVATFTDIISAQCGDEKTGQKGVI
jgi:hypothetical protein